MQRLQVVLFSLFILLLAACSGASPVESAAELVLDSSEPIEPITFTFFGDDPTQPIIDNGEREHWTGKYLNPGGVVYHEGVFHMFLNAFGNGVVNIGYYTSPDGYVWTQAADQPLFTSDELPYLTGSRRAHVSSALVTDDGTWMLYFQIYDADQPGVGRATAASPEGPWSFDAEMVLLPGAEGEWDSGTLSWPNVVATEEGYVMFYGAKDAGNGLAIGRATSADGITWSKYDDPATTDAPYADSDPVIVGSGSGWDLRKAERPRAVLSPDGWVMIYPGSILNRRGLAFSQDGIHWEGYAGNPFITEDNFPVPGSTWDTALVYQDGVYYYFMEIGSLAATRIYLATFEGPLLP